MCVCVTCIYVCFYLLVICKACIYVCVCVCKRVCVLLACMYVFFISCFLFSHSFFSPFVPPFHSPPPPFSWSSSLTLCLFLSLSLSSPIFINLHLSMSVYLYVSRSVSPLCLPLLPPSLRHRPRPPEPRALRSELHVSTLCLLTKTLSNCSWLLRCVFENRSFYALLHFTPDILKPLNFRWSQQLSLNVITSVTLQELR